MPVTVSLLQLVALPQSRRLWPEKFEALIAKAESGPRVKAQYGVIADWCQENDEPELAEAFRWVHKNPIVLVTRYGTDDAPRWKVSNLPGLFQSIAGPADFDPTTIAGAFATFSFLLSTARAKAQRQLEELA